MSTIHIVLRDTDDGLVDVETTVSDWDSTSNAQALASRVNEHIAKLCGAPLEAPTATPAPEPVKA